MRNSNETCTINVELHLCLNYFKPFELFNHIGDPPLHHVVQLITIHVFSCISKLKFSWVIL